MGYQFSAFSKHNWTSTNKTANGCNSVVFKESGLSAEHSN
jgi:hypothetical protein